MQCLSLSAVTDQQGLCYETSPTQPRRLALSGFTYATICNQDKQSHERRLRWARSCGKRWRRQSDQSRARVYIFTKIKPLRQRDMKRTNTQCVWASSAFVRLEKISCINKVWPVWSWDGKWAKSLTAQVQKTSRCHGSNIKRHVLTVKGPIKVLFGRWFVFFLPAAALLVFNSLRARREYKQNHPTSVNLRSSF